MQAGKDLPKAGVEATGDRTPLSGAGVVTRLINRKLILKMKRNPVSLGGEHEDINEQVSNPRRSDRTGGVGARAAGCARHRGSAAQLPRRPRGIPGGAAGLRPLPLRAPSR